MLLVVVGIVCHAVAVYMYLYTELWLRHPSRHVQLALPVASHASTEKQQQQQQHGSDAANVVEIQSVGSFTERVATFNAFLSSLRAEELKKRGTAAWQRPTSSRLDVLRGARDDYFHLLSNYSHVTTVALPWLWANSSNSSRVWSSLQDHSNLLIQTYYEWTADEKLCSWIDMSGKTKTKVDAVYNRKCSRNVKDTLRQSSVQPSFLHEKPMTHNYNYWPDGDNSSPAQFYTHNTPRYVFHMHIHQDAVVTNLGDVFTDGLKLVLYACSYDVNTALPLHLESIPLYNEVFVVTQFWGVKVFHRMVEILPRIALFVDFLNANPDIRILAPEVGGRLAELLEIIGLNKSRLVTGVSRAKVVYQPRATGCGYANVQESQMLSRLYRDYIKRTFPPQPRNRLILVRRSGARRFTERKGIQEVLERAARDYNLTYTLFVDNPTPSLNDTMMMFHSAVIIVAPVGAGESNMFFSQPGTYVIEGVCNPPHVNLCFQRLAYILGHHWHGIMSRGGCLNVVSVSIYEMDIIVRKFLHLWKISQN